MLIVCSWNFLIMTFSTLGLSEPILRAVSELGYHAPTPIQMQAIPPVLRGLDLLASAQTGTGKTAGFMLPLLQRVSEQPPAKSNHIRVLILAPTRELAAQIHASVIQYGQYLKVRSAVVYGGVKINPQMMRLRAGVEILIATPGRLLDLFQQRAIRFDMLDTVVLDEADRMLDMGFIHDIKRIIAQLPSQRQTLLFSATFSKEICQLASQFMKNPVEISVTPRNEAAPTIKQMVHPVDKGRKAALLSHLIRQESWAQALVFCKTKHGANKLVKLLAEDGIEAIAIHGNKSQSQRTKALADFKAGKVHILVATDIAARGIDIEELPMVINFDLPQVAEDYVHRIGRTGRAGMVGGAISLVCADEIRQLQSIEKLIKSRLERVEIDDFEPVHSLPVSVRGSQPTARAGQKPSHHRQQAQRGQGRDHPGRTQKGHTQQKGRSNPRNSRQRP